MSRSATIGRLAADFVIIVAGVLAALGVDQWRESRLDRERERQLLQSLILDLRADSADFANLPRRAVPRIQGAEVLLRNLAPGEPRGSRVLEDLESLGPFPHPATDEELVEAFRTLTISSDLDVARGAYRDFSENGGQHLIRNIELRRRIHDYYGAIEANLKHDPLVTQALARVLERSADLGLGKGDADAGRIRSRLRGAATMPFFASARTLQSESMTQVSIAGQLSERGAALRALIQSELDPAGS